MSVNRQTAAEAIAENLTVSQAWSKYWNDMRDLERRLTILELRMEIDHLHTVIHEQVAANNATLKKLMKTPTAHKGI